VFWFPGTGESIMTAANRTAPPSTAWREVMLEGEPEIFEKFAAEIEAFQRQDAKTTKDGKPLRGFHAKIHTGVMAEFEVLPDLPAHARCGVFAEPRVFPAVVRFSNGESTIHPDANHEPRGIAIKLIGVTGPKLLRGQENAVTQDFLATSHSVTSAVRNVNQFMKFVRAHRHSPKVMALRLLFTMNTFELLRIRRILNHDVLQSDVRSMAMEEYFGTAPIKFGPYAVKFSIKAVGTTAKTIDRPEKPDDFLREELAGRLRREDLVMDFKVQFYVDDASTPIEDTSVLWQTEPVAVARLRIPRVDLDDEPSRKLSRKVDALSFSPWHAVEDHRPLGNIMRARRVAYEASSALRGVRSEPSAVPLPD
jgi:hypothetical protein